MQELLAELPLPKKAVGQWCLCFLFAIGITAANTVQVLIWRYLGPMFAIFHVGAWLAWFFWHGVLFARGRRWALKQGVNGAYARAFFTHILPGVSFGVSQMTCPVVLGLVNEGPLFSSSSVAFGVALSAVGVLLMVAGFRTIGMARAGFLTEFRSVECPLLTSRIYRLMRHPLFVGGALLSMGGTLILSGDLWVAAINLAILPVYQRIEDRRLSEVFGDDYTQYVRNVGGVAPRFMQRFVSRRAQ